MKIEQVRLIAKLAEKNILFKTSRPFDYNYNYFDKDYVVYNDKKFVLSLYHVHNITFKEYFVLERVVLELNPSYRCGSSFKYIESTYRKREQYSEEDIADMLLLEQELNNNWSVARKTKVCSAVNSTVWNKFPQTVTMISAQVQI